MERIGVRSTVGSCWRSFCSLAEPRKGAITCIHPKGGISVALTIASREVDGVTVLDLSGRITLGEGSVQLRDAIRDLISKGSKNILLNLGDVNYIDSSGLGELVSAYTTAKNQGASPQAAQPDQKGQGRSATHQALHRLRHLRRRSQRHRLLQVATLLARTMKRAIPSSGMALLHASNTG